jgi:hypothetical protein
MACTCSIARSRLARACGTGVLVDRLEMAEHAVLESRFGDRFERQPVSVDLNTVA